MDSCAFAYGSVTLSNVGSSWLPGAGGGGVLADSSAPVTATAIAATTPPAGISAYAVRFARTPTTSAMSRNAPAATNPP